MVVDVEGGRRQEVVGLGVCWLEVLLSLKIKHILLVLVTEGAAVPTHLITTMATPLQLSGSVVERGVMEVIVQLQETFL